MRNLLRPDSQIISPVSELEKAGLAELASRKSGFQQSTGGGTPRATISADRIAGLPQQGPHFESEELEDSDHDYSWPVQCLDEVESHLRRLKTCRETFCRAAFYDRSRNNSRVWHDVHTSGNAVNLRAYRARQRVARSHPPELS
jgi:hypothetical protein